MREIVEKRTRNSKTFLLQELADGRRRFAWDGVIGAIHYKNDPDDPGESWKEIDNAFEPAQAPWDWQMLKAGYHVHVLKDFTYGQILKFEKQGESVAFQPMALEWTNDLDQVQQISMPQSVACSVTNPEVDLLPAVGMLGHQGTIRWDNGYGEGIDFEWRCTSTRLVKILEIEGFDKLPAPEQYIIDGGNPVLRLNLIFDPSKDMDIYVDGELWDKKTKVQTFNVIEFKKDGETLWGFMPLRYWDSHEPAEEEEEFEQQSIATLEKKGNSLYISIRVPYEWLQNATYPVFIDTPVDEQVGASADDCRVKTSDHNSISLTATAVYWGEYFYSYYGSGWRFQTVDIAQGATINTAYLIFIAKGSLAGTTNGDILGELIVDAAEFSTAANYWGRDRTTAIVDWDGAEPWTDELEYNSPEIKTIIQEIVNQGGWVADNDLVIFIEDNAETSNELRKAYSWDGSTSKATQLHIEYTEAGGVEVTPNPASAIAGIVNPTVVLGSISITPSVVQAMGSKVDPAIVLGSVSVIPTAASSIATIATPSVIFGSVSITPSASSAVANRVNPAVLYGSTTATPSPATTISAKADPTVALGSIILMPGASSSVSSLVAPTVILGSIAITPSALASISATVNPAVVLGAITLTPDPALAVSGVLAPSVVPGSITITPPSVTCIGGRANPTVELSSITLTPTALAAVSDRANPVVILGSLLVAPSAVDAIASSAGPEVILGSIALAPDAASAVAVTLNPTVLGGGETVIPSATFAIGGIVNPTVELGSISITPSAIDVLGGRANPTTVLGSLSLPPSAAVALVSSMAPSVVLGSLSVVPSVIDVVGGRANPVVQLGSTTATPDAALAIALTVDPTVIVGVVRAIELALELYARALTLMLYKMDLSVKLPRRKITLRTGTRW